MIGDVGAFCRAAIDAIERRLGKGHMHTDHLRADDRCEQELLGHAWITGSCPRSGEGGNPTKAVVLVTGDGGFLFGLQELATAAAHGIGVVTIVFNNHAHGNVRRDQLDGFEGRLSGAELRNPDFVKLADSFGVDAHRSPTPAALRLRGEPVGVHSDAAAGTVSGCHRIDLKEPTSPTRNAC